MDSTSDNASNGAECKTVSGPTLANLSNGYTVIVSPCDDDSQQYEVLDHAHSDFLLHFENEIRISPLCVDEHCSNNNVDTSAPGDRLAAITESWNGFTCNTVNSSQRSSDGTSNVALRTNDGSATSASYHPIDFMASDFLGDRNDATMNDLLSSASIGSSSHAGLVNGVSKKVPVATPTLSSAVAAAIRCPTTKATVRRLKDAREPSLSMTFPAKVSSYELKIIRQPEDQHRARYLTEGSRGTVKDKSQQSHPTVQLSGYDQVAVLQVFVGTEAGRMKPHGFYQACKVSGKNSTPCVERDIEGTTVIEILLEPKNDMIAVIDCIGILKLRNADVEQRIGLAKSKKKSTSARLVFRVNIPRLDGTLQTLQIASSTIICTQPVGAPEISKKSVSQSSPFGGDEMFIIGKNFMKGTVVVFEEVVNDRVVWSAEAEIDQDFFQATHLVCRVPQYHPADSSPLRQSKEVQVVVHSNGRASEPVPFFYVPDKCCETAFPQRQKSSSPVHSDRRLAAVSNNTDSELSSELKGDMMSRPASDGLSLKRPYDPSSQEDLSHVAKTAAVETVKDETDAENEVPEQAVSSDVLQNGCGKSNALTAITPKLSSDKDIVIERQIAQAELLFKQIIDGDLGVDTTDLVTGTADVVEQVPVRSVPYPSPPMHAQGPGGGSSSGTFNNQMYSGPGIVNSIDMSANFIQQSPSSIGTVIGSVTMDLAHTQAPPAILLTDKTSKVGNGEPQAKRTAAFGNDEIPVHMVMQLGDVGGSKSVTDDNVQWIQVDRSHPVVGTHIGLIDSGQPVLSIPSESFSFQPKLEDGVSNMSDDVMFNFGSGLVFAPAFSSSAVDGFRDGTPVGSAGIESRMSVEDMRILDVGLSSGPQSMETNIGTFVSDHDHHTGGFVDITATSFGNHCPVNSLHDGTTVLSQNQNENRGVFIGSATGRGTHSVMGMDVSAPSIHSTSLNPAGEGSPLFSGSDAVAYGTGRQVYVSGDQLQNFRDSRSEVGMEISTRQIAGMNLPEGLSSPLSIVTSPSDTGSLQQTLAELIDLQQQVAALGASSTSGTSSAPQSPPYRRLSVSRHDAPAAAIQPATEVGTQWSVNNSTVSWSTDDLFHESLNTHGNQTSTYQVHSAVPGLESVHGQLMTNSASIAAKSFTETYEADHLDNAGELIPSATPLFSMSTGISQKGDVIKWPSTTQQDLPANHHLDVVSELLESASTTYDGNLSTPIVREDAHNGGIFSVLVGSSSQPHATVHHHAHTSTSDLPLTTQSVVNVPVNIVHLAQPFTSRSDAPSSMPFVLVSSLQSPDASSARGHPVHNMNSTDSSNVSLISDQPLSIDMCIPAKSGSEYHPSTVEGEMTSKVPILLYKLLTEDKVQQQQQHSAPPHTLVDSTHSLPDLSFDDINQVLNSTSSHS